ncbi:hypothetical protein G7Z17_g291 [Cylindrodendrum hubeiense]|uniref:Rad50/SbcC-type AAA domain-containing protein n=1 Tax=Cylindrodendrum hubeiense TaxID=595255 RepID=A0A9P5HQ38_9HYPO|nr:hypothetical protein G7Z17_g291 [Cylindrodendrum hubeiense]
MLRPSAGTVRWLLLSDIHFKHRDLNRVRQTAEWIVSQASQHRVQRVVVCGDLLTSRTMQPTDVLSACYRFVGHLIDAVPRVNILLGNHDLAYRRDYQITALEALNINRLSPYVSLHSGIGHHEWDGRRVLLLPFREEQDELVNTIAAISPDEASKTVAFAHLAINKAITQRYVAGRPLTANPITYSGLTGPDRFASLARTFTGHFHSHQIITQKRSGDLQGSVTYLGSPLQLTWADLYDEQRGVVLFDPETLEHEMLVNPYGVGYVTADLQQVLNDQVDEGAVNDKHVMLLGELSHLKYITARDKLLSLGVRSVRGVREWNPTGPALNADNQSFGGLGVSVPASDAAVQPLEPINETGSDTTSDGISGSDPVTETRVRILDLATEGREYVESLELEEPLLSRRDELVRVGQRIIQFSREMADRTQLPDINYQEFLDRPHQAVGASTAIELPAPSSDVFVAEPRKLTITNFLGVQGTLAIDFRQDIPRGLTFLVGDNGSGKSTLVEAMVWCQFGQCIRSGLAVKDVVNDNVGMNCSVVLEFTNGYTIARYRKHRNYRNRVVVFLHGEPQLQLEHPDARATQAAIDELLGISYESYVRTVVLDHEGASSFLNSKPAERRDLIETSLGLSVLDQCGQVSKQLLKNLDEDVGDLESRLEFLHRGMEEIQRRLQDLNRKQNRVEAEAKEAVASLEAAIQENTITAQQIDGQGPSNEGYSQFEHKHAELGIDTANLEGEILTARKRVQALLRRDESAEISKVFHIKISTLQNHINLKQGDLQRLESSYALMQEQRQAESTSWLDQLQQQLNQKLECMPVAHLIGLRKFLHAVETYLLRFRLKAIRGLSYIFWRLGNGLPRTSTQDHDHEACINNIRADIKSSVSRLQSLKHEADKTGFAKRLTTDDAGRIKEQLAQAIQAQDALQDERNRQRERQREKSRVLEAFQQDSTLKQHEAATYRCLIEPEEKSLHSQRSEYDSLAAKHEMLVADRELFVFWSSTLTKRPRVASSSSSTMSSEAAKLTFRGHVLKQSLPKLNALLAQALTALYDDTRHARAMTTGMLRSLFDSDEFITNESLSSGSVLEPSLAINSSLAYGKRSGGERKRLNLALYFALLQLWQAGSAHRAHYVLVDEVFDSLDEAGQAAVVRWCGLMAQRVAGWIVVITHSRFLIERDPEENIDKFLVVKASMGPRGTELVVDGQRIGIQDGA